MCGIVAALPADGSLVDTVLRAQHARGPDETVACDLGWATVGINRLAISGLVGGSQPLTSPDGSITVVFNGAIYNFQQLADLFSFTPKSSNDGEIIPYLYQEVGLAFADYLEGMFAVCIADSRAERLVFATDQLGIKPLYVLNSGSSWLLASTPDALPSEIRGEVRRVPPGSVWTTDGEVARFTHRGVRTGSLGELLRRSVNEQVPQEVEWGCLLSGGVDSGLITRLASEHRSALPTFTVGTREGTDLAGARELAEILGTDHHELIIDPDELIDVVDDVVGATASMERWTVMGGVGTFLACREASRAGMKVVLSGEGADELFGGYDEFQDVPTPYLNTLLVQYQCDLGVSECLRLDRTAMAHSVEARVPFLSAPLIRLARALPPEMKIGEVDGRRVRKLALRRFAATVLPEHIAYRDKAEFSHGSGISRELERLAGQLFPASKVATSRARFPSLLIRDSLDAWFVDRWAARFVESTGTPWPDLVERGLFRQSWSRYLPVVEDPSKYSDDMPGADAGTSDDRKVATCAHEEGHRS